MRILRAAGFLVAWAAAAEAQGPALTLAYDVPPGWVLDVPAAQAASVQLLFLPRGKTVETTDRAVTIAYQAKHSAQPGLADLESFVRLDMAETRQRFPGLLVKAWQPEGLDQAQLRFRSVELYGAEPNEPPPHRVVFVDSGDGFYSLTWTATTRELLASGESRAFFDSLRLTPPGQTR